MSETTFKKCDVCGDILAWASVCTTCTPDGWLTRPMDEKPLMVNTTVADYLEDLSLAEKRGSDNERLRIIALLDKHTGYGDEEWDENVIAIVALIKGEQK